MATTDEVLEKLSKLLDLLNKDPNGHKANNKGILDNPIVAPITVTVIGSLLVAYGSNFVAKAFQTRDQQAEAVAAIEAALPKEIAYLTKLANLRFALSDQDCTDDKNKPLKDPFVYGLTGKTCGDAEVAYLESEAKYLDNSSGPSLARIRALFKQQALKDDAIKLEQLLNLLGKTETDSCILEASDYANETYEEIIDLAIAEINGESKPTLSPSLGFTKTLPGCPVTELCRIPAISKSAQMSCEKGDQLNSHKSKKAG